MKLNAGTRTRILWDFVLDVDPTGSTVEVKIDDTWHPCEWQGAPVKVSERRWTQTARTTGYFAGPDAIPAGATVLTAGQHPTRTRVSWTDSDSLVEPSTPIDVSTN